MVGSWFVSCFGFFNMESNCVSSPGVSVVLELGLPENGDKIPAFFIPSFLISSTILLTLSGS